MLKTKSAKEIILDRIESNIIGIYRNKRVTLEIEDFRVMFKIPDDLFDKNKDKFAGAANLDELIDRAFNIWADSIPEEGPKIQEIDKNISSLHSDYDSVKKEAEKINRPYPTRKNNILGLIKEIIVGKSFIYYLVRRNHRVWKKPISARLLTIPKNLTIKHRESILADYLPKVNDDLTIKIHEATEIGDFKFIKHELKIKKRAYKNKYKLQINMNKNKLYKRNLRAYELRRINKKSYKETRLTLEDEFSSLMPKECKDSDINKMVWSHLLYADDIRYPG
ncbi:MAG: hypothetical protein Q7K35_00930 [bacterium]|nr:hypothetical protein [bacterium]